MSWDTYTDLRQFKNWRGPVFDSFTGLRPNKYLEAKQLRDETKGRLNIAQNEIEIQRKVFSQAKKLLPKNLPSLDISAFKEELATLGKKAKQVQERQVATRAKLLATVTQRQRVESEVKLVSNAYKDLVGDALYLSDFPDGEEIECPTCGTRHKSSFHARLTLVNDADSMAALVAELSQVRSGLRATERRIEKDLGEIERDLQQIDELLETSKARLRLDDIVASYSRRTIDRAFLKAIEQMSTNAESLQRSYYEYNSIVKKYEDRKRAKQVTSYYSSMLQNISLYLNIPPDERVSETKIGGRPASGGSSGPRAVLALHLAMLATNIEFGDTVVFPFVVDTPQQSGQDEENLCRMINAIKKFAAPKHQLVLSVEQLPEKADMSEFRMIELSDRQLLRKDEFVDAKRAIGEMLRVLRSDEQDVS